MLNRVKASFEVDGRGSVGCIPHQACDTGDATDGIPGARRWAAAPLGLHFGTTKQGR